MKNLFIMHTQYNLILAAATLSRYKDAENTLVLYSEFALADDMRAALSKVFDRVIIVRDAFYTPKSALDEIREIRKCMKAVRLLKHERFDHVYMSQERIFDLILCARARKNNPNLHCVHIEEDVYYSINEKFNAVDYVPHESFRSRRRKFLYALLLAGYPYRFRETHYCYGMSSEYTHANLLFPGLARREVANKQLSEITKEELFFGIDALYSQKQTSYPQAERYTLFFFDLMNRYNNPENVKHMVTEIIKRSQEEGRTVLFKYHPRETEKIEGICGAVELPHLIPAEKVLFDLKDRDVIVVGNATTSCVVAAKIGFSVLSICKLEFPKNHLMHKIMEKMGICCIENQDDIKI